MATTTEHRPHFHHSSTDYKQAASAAAANARTKIQKMIDDGKAQVGTLIKNLVNRKIEDHVVPLKKVVWDVDANGIVIQPINAEGKMVTQARHLHRHALQQAVEKLKLPITYVDHLNTLGRAGHELIAHNLTKLGNLRPDNERVLVRRDTAHETVLGILSDKYRRLDTPTTVDAFATAAAAIGAVPVKGYAGIHTRTVLKALLPYVFEPMPNEVLALGLSFENSDYGDGACSVRVFILRLWCTNFAITENAMRQVHVGKRLSDDMQYSEETYRKDAEATASAIKDIVAGHLSPPGVERVLDGVRAAYEAKVDGREMDVWLRKHLTKEKAEKVHDAFVSADIENLPPGQSAWRLSNALSWVANSMDDEYDKLDLMKLAGKAADVTQLKGLLAEPKKEKS